MTVSKFFQRAWTLFPIFLLSFSMVVVGTASSANAASVTVSAGDSDFKVVATAKVSDTSVSRNTAITGTGKITFKAYALGLPMPARGYYINSFPTKFKQPALTATNGSLKSLTYRKIYVSSLGRTQWVVYGSNNFWGSQTITIKGKARAATKGSGYFHAGTGSSHDTDANAIIRVTVK